MVSIVKAVRVVSCRLMGSDKKKKNEAVFTHKKRAEFAEGLYNFEDTRNKTSIFFSGGGGGGEGGREEKRHGKDESSNPSLCEAAAAIWVLVGVLIANGRCFVGLSE